MRFSATEQIIRDAEQQDAGGATTRVAGPPVKRGEAAPSSTARDLFKLQEAERSFEVDIEDPDGGDDDEGETLVDTARAAAALQEMRSYGASRKRPRSNDVAGNSAGLSTRPVVNGLASAPRPSPLASQVLASPTPTLRWAGGVPPGRPAAWPNPSPVTQDAQRAQRSGEGRPTPLEPLVGAAAFNLMPARRTVGRRQGILIAAATAAAVVLGIGTWTTRSGRESPSALGSAAAPRAPVAALIVPTPPTVPEVPVAEPVPVAIETPPAGADVSAEASDSETQVSPAPPVARAKHAPAKIGKARTVRKPTPNKARRSKRHAAKVAAVRAQPKRALVAAPPAPARAQVPIRSLSDPDATLPITD